MVSSIESDDGSVLFVDRVGLANLDIRKGQEFISNEFSSFYEKAGYQFVTPEDLLPRDDSTVLFTGATITALKRFLVNGVDSPGYFTIQKCLRTQGSEWLTDLNNIPTGINYFTMCGILASPDSWDKVASEGYDLLVNRLGIPSSNILIEIPSDREDLSGGWREKGVAVNQDSRPETSFMWGYGMPGIYGIGINILVRFGERGEYKEVGNHIAIYSSEGSIVGYEFGFGLESLLAKTHGLNKSTQAHIISSVIPYREGVDEKVVNTLVTCLVLLHHGIQPGKGRERFVLKKHIKGLSFLRRKLGWSIEQLKEYGGAYEEVEFGQKSESANQLALSLEAYELQLAKFYDYAKNQTHAHMLRNQLRGVYLIEKIRREGLKLGILPVEIDEIIQGLFKE